MSAIESLGNGLHFEENLALRRGSHQSLNVVMVYQDPVTRDWANDLWSRVSQLIGPDEVCLFTWKIDDLANSQVFPECIRRAAEADIILIAVRVADALPVSLYVWITAWLPRRQQRSGALVTLLGISDQPGGVSLHPERYFQAVARRAGMDFLPRERKITIADPNLESTDNLQKRANAVTPTLGGILAKEADTSFRRWGINE